MTTGQEPTERGDMPLGRGDLPSERLRSLARAAAALNASLSVSETVERVTHETRAIIGAEHAVTSFTMDPDCTQTVTAVSSAHEGTCTSDGEEHTDETGVYRLVCERNEPLRLTPAEVEAHPAWRSLAGDGDVAPPRGWLAAPLVRSDGSNLGLVQLSGKEHGEFTADDEATLVQLAQLASIAVENATVYERERARAQSLQRQQLPEQLPRLEGLSFAARYLAGGHGSEVGGDWYDVLTLDDQRVALVVGDVMGRGVSAASVMGQLRIGVRAYALQGLPPGTVLESLDRLVDSLDDDYFVTLLYAEWDLAQNTVTFANAGHLPPLLRLPDRTTVFLRGNQGTPIGVHGQDYRDHHVDAPAGSTLLLLTDGLVEHRDLMLERTLGTLARTVAAGAEEPEALADEILAALPPSENDDVTLFVSHRPSTSAVEQQQALSPPAAEASVRLPASPEAAADARSWIATSLTQRGFGHLAEVAELLTSELVTNAVLHAATELTLTLSEPNGSVRVAVSDEDLELPSVGALDVEATSGRGMQLVDTLAPEWGVCVRPAGKTVWFELAAHASLQPQFS